MGSEELKITWNNHHGNVLGVFGQYLAEETLVDCTIAAEGECLNAHRLVLSACSTYFEMLFNQEMYEIKFAVIEDIKFQDLKSLIAFMYDGQITIPKDKLRDYVKAAEFLQIRGLPRESLLNCLREATEESVLCRKEGVALQSSHKLMGSSAMGGESLSFQWVSSSSGKETGDEEPSTCMRMEVPEENVHLQHEYIRESVSKTETAKFSGEKEPSVEPKEEVDVEETPISESEDLDKSAVTDVSLAAAGGVVLSELPPVPGTISSRNGFANSSLILEKDSETSLLKFSSVSATTPSSTNTAHSSHFVPNDTTEKSGWAMELSSSCEQTELTEQIICVKKEPLEKTEIIPAVISLKRESRVEPMHEVWVEELQRYEDQEVISETYSDNTCNEQTTIQDLDAAVVPDNSQSAVWPNDTFKAHPSACVEVQRVRKEVHSLEIKKETEYDEECFAGECTKTGRNDSTVDKEAESGLSVVEIDEDYVIKEEHVMEGQEIVETVERTLEADVAVKKSEVEEENSIPLSERISKMLQRQSHRCLKCASVFSSVNELWLHVRNMHTKKSSKRCEVCQMTFASRSQLMIHMRKHTNQRPFKSNVSSESSSQENDLNVHKCIHTDERRFKRDVCSVSFSQNAHLNNHKLIHTGGRPFHCDVCKMTFRQKVNFCVHKMIHTGERPFMCNLCKSSFVSKSRLTKHMFTHTGERPFQCNVCEKTFTEKNSLTHHIRTHTGERPYQCSVCQKSLTKKSNLTSHMRTHTGERPFQCDVCEKSFTRKGDLIRHMCTHTGMRPFQCHVCEKLFRHKFNLSSHMRTHTGERPFQCNVCQKFCKERSSLTKHMLTHRA